MQLKKVLTVEAETTDGRKMLEGTIEVKRKYIDTPLCAGLGKGVEPEVAANDD